MMICEWRKTADDTRNTSSSSVTPFILKDCLKQQYKDTWFTDDEKCIDV